MPKDRRSSLLDATLNTVTPVKVISYDDLKHMRLFVTNHWDVNLDGLCRVDGELCRFATVLDGEGDVECVHIYRMTRMEKLRGLLRKRLFEVCVGRHWTFPDRDRGAHYRVRKPKWLHHTLVWLFYGLKGRWFKWGKL
jgi:hypothetical protein